MIRDFHAHIYFDAEHVEKARALGDAAHERFGVPPAIIIFVRSAPTRAEAAS